MAEGWHFKTVNWKMLTTKKLRFSMDSLRSWIAEGLRASDLSGRVMAPSILFSHGSLQSGECDVDICLGLWEHIKHSLCLMVVMPILLDKDAIICYRVLIREIF